MIDTWHLDTLRARPNEDPFEYLQRRAFRFSDLRDRIVKEPSKKGKGNKSRRTKLRKESLANKVSVMREWEKWLEPMNFPPADNLEDNEDDNSESVPEFSEEMAIDNLYKLFNNASQEVCVSSVYKY